MSMEHFVVIGAVLCTVPVAFGLIVAKWDRAWSAAARKGPLR